LPAVAADRGSPAMRLQAHWSTCSSWSKRDFIIEILCGRLLCRRFSFWPHRQRHEFFAGLGLPDPAVDPMLGAADIDRSFIVRRLVAILTVVPEQRASVLVVIFFKTMSPMV
jgi:hypothetical protein